MAIIMNDCQELYEVNAVDGQEAQYSPINGGLKCFAEIVLGMHNNSFFHWYW